MPAYDEINQAVRILEKTNSCFPLDLIVHTPHSVRWRLEEGDWFLREIVAGGMVLYEKAHRGVGSQGRERLPSRQKTRRHASNQTLTSADAKDVLKRSLLDGKTFKLPLTMGDYLYIHVIWPSKAGPWSPRPA